MSRDLVDLEHNTAVSLRYDDIRDRNFHQKYKLYTLLSLVSVPSSLVTK